jgi:TonB family protein
MPARIKYLAERMQADLTEIQHQGAALNSFYALLSTEQRRLLDDTTKPNKGQLGVAVGGAPVAAPDTPDYGLPSHTDPSWMVKPNADDLSRVYPSKALALKLSGLAQLTCVADEDGYLKDCMVQEEDPKDVGFGNAALELSAYMRMNPATNYGIPVESQVNVPVRFAPSE